MKYLKGFVLGLAIVVGVQFVSAAWTDPSATPPGNNTDTPINVGLSQQDKLGSLFVNTDTSNPYAIGLGVFGKSVFNGSVQINDTTASPGYVLVSTDGYGDAQWTSTSSLGISGGGGVTSVSRSQIVSGFPNVIVCKSGTTVIPMYILARNNWGLSGSSDSVGYASDIDTGGYNMRLYYDYATGNFLQSANSPDGTPTLVAAEDACEVNISQIPSLN